MEQNVTGVHKHVFNALMLELVWMGHRDSKNVTLKEQLALSLYTCVTELMVHHVGERFQHGNETITKWVRHVIEICNSYMHYRYFKKMACIFTSRHFFNKFVCQSTAHDPPPPILEITPNFGHFSREQLAQLMEVTSILPHHLLCDLLTEIERVICHKIAFSPVHGIYSSPMY